MSKQFVISSGHGEHVSGAIGILDEHQEAKKVVDRVYAILTKTYDGIGFKYHETSATTQQRNLDNIVNYHNGKKRDLDVSVHFNSGPPSASGTECLYYDAKSLSAKMAISMATSLGIANRGPKERKELYFLRNTTKPAILLETCFVSSKLDAKQYKENFELLCQGIAQVIAGYLGYKKKGQATTGNDRYYTKGTGKYQIRKACGAYNGKIFDEAEMVYKLKPGEVFTITAIVKAGSAYRLKTKSGLYITAHKDYVKPL